MKNTQGSAPNFKQTCIVMFGINIAWVFFVIWSIWGLIAVASTGWCINRAISLIASRQE
jgi:hypothetical protein